MRFAGRVSPLGLVFSRHGSVCQEPCLHQYNLLTGYNFLSFPIFLLCFQQKRKSPIHHPNQSTKIRALPPTGFCRALARKNARRGRVFLEFFVSFFFKKKRKDKSPKTINEKYRSQKKTMPSSKQKAPSTIPTNQKNKRPSTDRLLPSASPEKRAARSCFP